MGWGWGGVGWDNTKRVSRFATRSSLALDATLHDLHLHLMPRYMFFTCTWCYATWSSLALDATLHDLHLHLMLRYMIFTGTWCYATWSSFSFAMDKSATSNSKKRLGGNKVHCQSDMIKSEVVFWFSQNAFLTLRKQKWSFRFNEITISCSGNVRKRHGVLSAAHQVVNMAIFGLPNIHHPLLCLNSWPLHHTLLELWGT